MPPEAEQNIDHREFRRALGHFMTGVTIVTTVDSEGRPRGLTANSFTSVSLEPPLILVCIGQTAASFSEFQTTDRFAVSVLAAEQRDTSKLFASQRDDKFETVAWRMGEGGSPILDTGLAWYECHVHDRILAGDHLILIGRVISCRRKPGRPLGFFQGGYVSLGAEAVSDRDTRHSAPLPWSIATDGPAPSLGVTFK